MTLGIFTAVHRCTDGFLWLPEELQRNWERRYPPGTIRAGDAVCGGRRADVSRGVWLGAAEGQLSGQPVWLEEFRNRTAAPFCVSVPESLQRGGKTVRTVSGDAYGSRPHARNEKELWRHYTIQDGREYHNGMSYLLEGSLADEQDEKMYEAALLFLQNFRLYRVDGCVEFLYTAYEKEWG